MVPACPRSVARLVSCSAVLALVGCGEPSAPSADTPRAADAPAKTGDAKIPGDAQIPGDAKTPEPEPEPTAAPAGEDWLVWSSRGDQWVTRWIDATARESTQVAERQALVLSDGTRLWRLERHDAEVDVLPCECLEDEGAAPAGCKPRARLTLPGLRAVELVGGAVISVRAPETSELYGEGIEHHLEPVGGAGSRLFYAWGESGYMCGAHGLVEGGTGVFDLAVGAPVEDPFSAVGRALPAEVREPAGTEIQARLQECDADAPTLREVLDGQMGLAGLRVGLGAGVPRIEWDFAVDTYYACSPDYTAWGQARSGLMPAAAPLGLDGLPGGVTHALAQLGDASTVGWARLSLTGPARAAALEAFRSAPEVKWPPASITERPVGAEDPEARRRARTKLDEGRRLTRSRDYAAAITTLDAAIELDPALARAWSERGYAKLLAGDLPGARIDLEAALPLDQGAAYRAAVHYNLGQVAERSGDEKAAEAAYTTSLALRDNETVRKALAGLR
jgi:hypothetical protein